MGREQAGVWWAEEGQGVRVGAGGGVGGAEGRPVEAGRGWAAGVGGEQGAQRGSCGDAVAFADGGGDRFVGGSGAVLVVDGDHRAGGHLGGVDHGALGGCHDLRAWRGGEVDAPVAAGVRGRGRVERADHLGDGGQGPDVAFALGG